MASRRIGPAILLHLPRTPTYHERYALILGARSLEVPAPREIIRTLDRTWRRAAWPLVRRYRDLRADLAWRAMRRLPCRGQHPTSVISDGACDQCRPLLERCYPQGWRYYPGDCCPHGVYVGGCGPDLMCGQCEAGL